jgi:CDP-4-dehydro-6-deoxyglucose reductase, E3
MTHRVHMLPTGHEFLVEGVESLVEAALRAGLAPEYGCNNGTCGLCKARLVSGEVRQIRHHDHPFSEAEKAQGHFLMCSYTALTDLAVEAPEAWGAQGIPVQQISARVKKVERPGPDVCILHLQTPRTQRLRFLAGQYASIAAPNIVSADFSIASCPCDGRNLELHVPRQPGLPFSDYVFAAARAQDTLSLEGPKGSFTLREDNTSPIVFLACDTGFGPVKSLVEQAMAVELPGPMHLYWLASPGVGHYMRNLCRSWVDALDNFYYTALTVSAPGDPSVPLAAGGDSVARVLRRMVRDHADIASCQVYVAGPSSLIASAERFLLRHGVLRDRIFAERVPRQP